MSSSSGRSATSETFEQLHEALLSTEYGPDGRPRRIGLELYPAADSIPIRVAGEATHASLLQHRRRAPDERGADPALDRGHRRRRPGHPARGVRPPPIKAVISDFGGVLTTPLMNSFAAFQDQTGISAEALGRAMQTIAERDGEHPLYALETGRMTEANFLASRRRPRSSPSSATAPRCTASRRSTSRRWSRTSR